MPISTNGVIVTRLAGALYNQQLSNATYNEVLSAFNSPAALNSLANYLISTDFASKTDLQIANTIVTNLGLSSVAGVANWVSAQLTAAGSAGKGAKIISLLNDFSNIDASDVTYGALATAFNSKIDAAQGLSQTTGNTGTTFAAAGTVGKSFPLTTGVDVFTGSSGDDSFTSVIANVGAANSTGTTLQAGDVLNGGTGSDTLSISVTGAFGGSTSAVTLTGIEKVSVSNVSGAAQTISMSLADSSLTTVGNSSSNTGATTTFSGLSKIVAAEMSNGDGGLTLTYNTSVVAGTADVASLTLSNQTTGGTFTATGIETLNVASNTSANAVTLAAGPTTVNVSGTARLTLGQLDTGITTLNASTNSGGLVATLSSTATAVITGSSGNDTITAGTNMSGAGAVSAGDGVDTLVSTADALIATTADGARFTGFETLSISSTGLGATATRAQNMAQIAGITTLNVTSARANGTANDTTHTVTLSNLPATLNTLNVTGLANADVDVADDFDVTVIATRAVNTTADAMTVNLGSSSATVGTTATATAGGTLGSNTLALSLANEESITINSLGGTTGTNFVAAITNGSATSVTATGARALSYASMSSTVIKTIDASAMTGAFIMGTNNGTVTSTITGGSGADTLNGGTAADNIVGGAGNDSISGDAGNDVITGDAGNDTIVGAAGIDNLSGGAGNDTFSVTTAAHFTGLTTAETVSGGDGNDNLSFSETANPITIASTDLLGINSIETITINGTSGAGSITLTDAVYAANSATTLAIVDGDLTTAGGSLTVNASALTAANSVVITANTATGINDSLVGGAGADTFKFSTTAGLEAGDTVTGGAGTDTIELTATSAAVSAALGAVTGVERIVTVGSGGNVIINGLVDAVISTTGTLTTDASSLTNGTATLAYDGTGVGTTATKVQNVTGGSGDDTISGGIGNDIIVGGDGNDSIVGGTGIDNLSGGNGNDTFTVGTVAHFVGLNSVETVSGGLGNDTLLFNVGANALTVNAADLLGLSSVETISVQSGNATAAVTLSDAVFTANGVTSIALGSATNSTEVVQLNASGVGSANSVAFTAGRAAAKSDSLVGGSGNDSFTFNTTTSGDALAAGDTVNGGAGNDLLTITLAINDLTAVTLTNVSNIERLTVSGTTFNAGTITLVNGNFATVTGAAITASSLTTGTFSLDASVEAESTLSITGGGGADTIIGGQVADTISGGTGADVITGGLGADSLTGGLGADTFVYALVTESNGTNTDTVTDFVSGTDKLQVTLNYSTLVTSLDINAVRTGAGVAGSSAAQDTLSGQRGQYVYDTTGSSLFINFNADNLLTTADYKININPASTASASIVDGDVNFVITGGTAADVIVAGGGADNIDGGAGADNINGGAGIDTITGGTGADTITGGAGNDSIILGSEAATVDTLITLVGSASTLTAVSTANGTDSVTGFQVGAGGDVLDFSAIAAVTAGTVAQLSTQVTATNAALTAGDNVIWLNDGTAALNAADATALAALTTAFTGVTTGNVIVAYTATDNGNIRIALATLTAGDISAAVDIAVLVGVDVDNILVNNFTLA